MRRLYRGGCKEEVRGNSKYRKGTEAQRHRMRLEVRGNSKATSDQSPAKRDRGTKAQREERGNRQEQSVQR